MIKSIPAFIIACIFLVIGICMLIKRIKQHKNNTSLTQATIIDYVVENHYDADTGDSYVYYPILQYQVDGIKYTQKNEFGLGKRKYPIGSSLTINYNPNNPEQINMANNPITWILPIIVIVVGVVVIIAMII